MDVYFMTDAAIIQTIGKKIKAKRIEQQLTQKQLAEQAGVSLSAVFNIEQKGTANLMTMVQVLRALHSLNMLESFFHEEVISPIAYAKLLDKQRPKLRVRPPKNKE